MSKPSSNEWSALTSSRMNEICTEFSVEWLKILMETEMPSSLELVMDKMGDIFSYLSETNYVICKICHQSKSKDEFPVEKNELFKTTFDAKHPYSFCYFYSKIKIKEEF